jgi:hypothetical protein
MKVQDYAERNLEVSGWPVHLTSYRLGDEYVCVADNVSPGARLARVTGSSREDAESKAIERAGRLLAQTRRQAV